MRMETKVSKVTVVSNEKGGATFIDANSASVVVMQKRYISVYKDGQLAEGITETRLCELTDTPSRILGLKLIPGDELEGNIYIKQQLYPVLEYDEEMYLLRDPTGKCITYEGNCIWQISYYTEAEDEDQILVDSFGIS